MNPDAAVIVALGANLRGEYASLEALLESALAKFEPAGLKIVARSSWWRSAAWPDPAAPEYRNGVVVVETALGPRAVLAALREIEQAFGRDRGERNAPRTLDLDLIAHGRIVLDGDALILPHPRAHERLFVMGPLAEISSRWVHPRSGATADALRRQAGVGTDARPVGDEA